MPDDEDFADFVGWSFGLAAATLEYRQSGLPQQCRRLLLQFPVRRMEHTLDQVRRSERVEQAGHGVGGGPQPESPAQGNQLLEPGAEAGKRHEGEAVPGEGGTGLDGVCRGRQAQQAEHALRRFRVILVTTKAVHEYANPVCRQQCRRQHEPRQSAGAAAGVGRPVKIGYGRGNRPGHGRAQGSDHAGDLRRALAAIAQQRQQRPNLNRLNRSGADHGHCSLGLVER